MTGLLCRRVAQLIQVLLKSKITVKITIIFLSYTPKQSFSQSSLICYYVGTFLHYYGPVFLHFPVNATYFQGLNHLLYMIMCMCMCTHTYMCTKKKKKSQESDFTVMGMLKNIINNVCNGKIQIFQTGTNQQQISCKSFVLIINLSHYILKAITTQQAHPTLAVSTQLHRVDLCNQQ